MAARKESSVSREENNSVGFKVLSLNPENGSLLRWWNAVSSDTSRGLCSDLFSE